MAGNHGAGKGDTYRKIDYDKWSKNYDKIFKKKVRRNNVSKTNSTKHGRTTSK
jgi:hypothetical protein